MTAIGRTPRDTPVRLVGSAGTRPTRTPPGGVLVGVDTDRPPSAATGGSIGALAWAAAEAAATGRPLHLLTACAPVEPLAPTFGRHGTPWDEPGWQDAGAVLGRLVEALAQEPAQESAQDPAQGPGGGAPTVPAATSETATGHAGDVLLEACPTAAVLVVGRHRRGGLLGWAEGSTALTVAGRSPVPVAVVPEDWLPPTGPVGAVVVGVDLHPEDLRVAARSGTGRHLSRSRASRAGTSVAAAAAYAGRRGVTLLVVSCWDPPPELAWSADQLATHEEHRAVEVGDWVATLPQLPTGLDIRVETRVGRAADELLTCARSSSLMVLGRHPGRLRTSGFPLGSTTRSLLQHAPGPVLVVPHA